MDNNILDSIVESQLCSLDDADDLASAWLTALEKWHSDPAKFSWGGYGKGGRGLSRQTFQPKDVTVQGISLEYAGSNVATSRTLLSGSSDLKLLHGHVYALTGRNGSGKTTLMRRINSGKVPGFPPHISSTLIPQEVLGSDNTAVDTLLSGLSESLKAQITALESQIDELDVEDSSEEMELLCEKISDIEIELETVAMVEDKAKEALKAFGITDYDVSLNHMSGGNRKKVYLARALFSLNKTSLLMLDEPTNMLDIEGIYQLRKLIAIAQESDKIVLIVTHDIDLINDCATDVIHLTHCKLDYYRGNYCDFKIAQTQHSIARLKQQETINQERMRMFNTIENMKKHQSSTRSNKKNKTISSRKKKLERHGVMKDSKGHRWSMQKAGTGLRDGSINSIDASSRKRLTYSQLLKRIESSCLLEPDKAVQFNFRDPSATWGEPLVVATNVSYEYTTINDFIHPLLEDVDICIEERCRIQILGKNGSGKTSLLKMIAGVSNPSDGTIQYASGLKVSYFSQHVTDDLIASFLDKGYSAKMLMMDKFPDKGEEEVRADLNAFGLGSDQIDTNLEYLSGGERCRLCLTVLIRGDVQSSDLLVMDEPTVNLDAESVEALAWGLTRWKGSIVIVSHDANLLRILGGTCYAILEDKHKLCRVEGGIDSYLKSFS